MSTSTKITLERYHEMIEQGLFVPHEEHHVELIEGEITPMSPLGRPHNRFLARLIRWSCDSVASELVEVNAQSSIEIPELVSEPQPDLYWAMPIDYGDRLPRPDDVLLLIEVADHGLEFDRGRKARLYARGGIADYWIVNRKDACVEVRRDPEGDAYRTLTVFRTGEEVRPLAFPEMALPVAMLFPD